MYYGLTVSPPVFRYLGFLIDPSYGPDFEGELFTAIADAKLWLQSARKHGHNYRVSHVHRDGSQTADFMPCVSKEAQIFLYRIPDVRVHYRADFTPELPNTGLIAIDSDHFTPDYPDARVYFGPRGGIAIERF